VISNHEDAEAIAASALEYSLTAGRRQLREVIDSGLRRCFDRLLPGIDKVLTEAARKAPTPPPPGTASPRRNKTPWALEEGSTVTDSPVHGGAAKPSLCVFSAGERVLVTGLTSRPELNGHEGIVRSLRSDGRIEVEVEEEITSPGNAEPQRRILALRPETLASVAEPQRRRDTYAYLVDNSLLKSEKPGIGYRLSPNLEDGDMAAAGAPWGSVVEGRDIGDGWLQVGNRFLPMELSGIRVLVLLAGQDTPALATSGGLDAGAATAEFLGAGFEFLGLNDASAWSQGADGADDDDSDDTG